MAQQSYIYVQILQVLASVGLVLAQLAVAAAAWTIEQCVGCSSSGSCLWRNMAAASGMQFAGPHAALS